MKRTRIESIARRHNRIRKTVNGSTDRPRLSVFRSHQHIYAQIIDDTAGRTIVAASTIDKELQGKLETGSTRDAATEVGKLVAARAMAAGVSKVVFDRGGNLYHGRVQALAEAARGAGLDF